MAKEEEEGTKEEVACACWKSAVRFLRSPDCVSLCVCIFIHLVLIEPSI